MRELKKKSVIVIVIIFLLSLISVLIYFDCNNTTKGIENYNEEYNEFSLYELGVYKNIYYQCAKTGGYLFTSYGSLIVADYDDNFFTEQIKLLKTESYQNEPVLFDKTKYILPETDFSIGNWNFKVLANDNLNYGYPKIINFIAVNQNNNQIAYLTFYDQDIDYLCTINEGNDYMPRFIKKYFKYNFQ